MLKVFSGLVVDPKNVVAVSSNGDKSSIVLTRDGDELVLDISADSADSLISFFASEETKAAS